MLCKGHIRPSSALFTRPTILVKKKNGETRVCIDFREQNKNIIPDIYPLFLMEQLITANPNPCFFTKIDLRSAFNRIRIREGDEK
jgi:hypothetical protein